MLDISFILGDSWNYMRPIFVPSFAKRIATQILVIAKLDWRNYFILRGFFVISFVPTRNYLFKVNNWSTRIEYKNCLRLGMRTLERCQWHLSRVYIVSCDHISNFLPIIDFEQAKVCWVHIEKINTFKDKIRYIMRYVAVI